MSYLEELLPEFRKGAKIRIKDWDSNRYIYFCNGCVFSADDNMVFLPSEYINSPFWELYQEPEPDWDYIIKNKCLCWFWDKSTSKCIGLLKQYGRGKEKFFVWQDEDENTACFDNCRPVRRDEVTFYEDRKDEE